MTWRVGVDSGGTFTDVCLFDDATGQLAVWKVPSTPDDPSRGIADGVAQALSRQDASPAAVGYFGHGTTVATNALIQHRGARTGLITTDGFRDLLEIGRQKRPDLYDLQADKPPTLVPRERRLEVPERVRHDGTVEIPLDEAAFRAAVRRLRDAGVEAVAVCFLYSFLATQHESAAAPHSGRGTAGRVRLRLARRRPGIPRIRAPVHDRGERLARPGDARLHPAPG